MIRSKERKIAIFEKFCDITKHIAWITKLKNHKIEFYLDENNTNHCYELIENLGKLGFKIKPSVLYKNDAAYIFIDYKKYEEAIARFNNEKFIIYWDSFIELPYLICDNDKLLCLSTYQMDKYIKEYQIINAKYSTPYNYQNVVFENNSEIGLVGTSISNNSYLELSFMKELKQKSFELGSFISFFWDKSLRGKTVIKSLLELSKLHKIIIVSNEKIQLDEENILITDFTYENEVIKNAKCNICGYQSENFIKCCYNNVPVLPVFTRYIDILNANAYPLYRIKNNEKERFYAFTNFLVQDFVVNQYLEYIVPRDIQNIQGIHQALSHSFYWKQFLKSIVRINSELLGCYTHDVENFTNKILNIMAFDTILSPRKVI